MILVLMRGKSLKINMIESAMTRRVRAESVLQDNGRSVGRRAYDEALSRRMHQLRSASGELDSIPAGPTIPLVASDTTTTSPVPLKTYHGRLIATHLIAALAGGVVAWYLMHYPERASKTSETMGSQLSVTPVVVPNPVTPISAENAPAPVATIEPPAVSVEQEIRDTLEKWSQAWSRQDVDAYLAFYSSDFLPGNGVSHAAWADGRRKKLTGRSGIRVALNDIKIDPITPEKVSVHFLQDYASGTYREMRQGKEMLLQREGTTWRIIGEK